MRAIFHWSSIVCLLVLLTPSAQAELRPKWEYGLGLAVLELPDYPGSDESATYLAPYPYIEYHGTSVRISREGIQRQLLVRDRLKLDFSLGASAPVKSSDNNARQGMDDIDPLLEIGPSLRFDLSAQISEKEGWYLELPLRAVFSIDLSDFRQRGWILHPQLRYSSQIATAGAPINWDLSVGPVYATADYHNHILGVESRFASADRPTYQTGGGFSGSRISLVFNNRLDSEWLLGGFVRLDHSSGAVWSDSPLVKSDHTLMMGIALTWIFGISDSIASPRD